MVVEVYPFPTGPITSYTSRRYTATANGVPTFCYGTEVVGVLSSAHYAGTTVEASYAFVGSDQTVEFLVSRHAPGSPGTPVPITSVAVFPETRGITVEIVGGAARVRVPEKTVAWLSTNGDYANPIILMNDPPAPPIGGAVTYASLGSPSTIPAGTRVYFPPGVHFLNGAMACPTGGTYRTRVSNDCDIIIQGGAIVVGNFDTQNNDNIRFFGPGLLSGAFATWSAVQALSFSDQVTYPLLFTAFASSPKNVSALGLKLVRSTFYSVWFGANSYDFVHVVNPGFGNLDGLSSFRPNPSSDVVSAKHCFVYCGDSGIQMLDQVSTYQIEDCFAVTSNNGCYLFGFWGDAPTGRFTNLIRCSGMQLGIDDSGEFGPPAGPGPAPFLGNNAAIVWWCDCRDAEPFNGRSNVYIEDFEVTGPSCSRAFAVLNETFPSGTWGTFNNDGGGVTSNWTFNGFTCAATPRQRAVLWGRDRLATPSRIFFNDVRIGGTLVDAVNWSEFVDMNSSPYFVFVGGKEVVTEVSIVNIALGYAGQSARVTSIAPLDGTKEADIAVRHYGQRVNTLLSRHRWSFATKSPDVVAVTGGATSRWDYCYELPSDFLSLQALLPPGVRDADAGITPAHYAIELDADGTQRIYTDVEIATVIYTSTVTNPNLFSTLFIEALAWDLAAVFAAALVQGQEGIALQKHCLQMREMSLAGARTNDADQRFVAPFNVGSSISARA